MKKSDAILRISNKLQKQFHLIDSSKNSPKMICDNLAIRIMTEIEEMGMRPPATYCCDLDPEWFGGEIATEDWENEEEKLQNDIGNRLITKTIQVSPETLPKSKMKLIIHLSQTKLLKMLLIGMKLNLQKIRLVNSIQNRK